MCLYNLESQKEVKEFKKTLPTVFDVWKMVYGKKTAFYQKGEPTLDKKGVYKAGNFPKERVGINTYIPGFHAFFSKKDAKEYRTPGYSIRKFRVKRQWLREIGFACDNVKCGVFSHIEVI